MSQVRALLSHPEFHGHAVIAQSVERLPCKQDAAGSIPAGGTIKASLDAGDGQKPAHPGATSCTGIPVRAGRCDGDQHADGAAIPTAWLAAGGRAPEIPVYLRVGNGPALCKPNGDVGERMKPAPC